MDSSLIASEHIYKSQSLESHVDEFPKKDIDFSKILPVTEPR